MINHRIFESLILINTIVVAFCIVLLVTFTVFIILFLLPLIRRQWLRNNEKEENEIVDISSLSRQPSFHNLTPGSSRLNPIFEQASDTTTNTQFGTLFHPQSTIATLLHPTIWTSMTPTSVLSSPLSLQAPSTLSPSTKPAVLPPLPSHPPTTITTAAATTAQKFPKKR